MVICLAAVVKNKDLSEIPDLTFKGRVNLDTQISQINEKKTNMTSMKTSFHGMFIIFYIREISYKSQFIKSLPVISNTRQPALEQLQSNFALNVTFQK